ncbi:redoxin domain-containing protein [Jannaschia sp. 2305UL9-9]|uniref:redoxin domain-containing protein n=1 Tax=Jannaschia sp. 2305UL9-9 TaxID=3121638 RepID=UPI003527A99F
MLKPSTTAPALVVPRLSGTEFDLTKTDRETFIVFYRGLHCPACRRQLEALVPYLADFEDRGIDVIAVSMDTKDRASGAREEWDIAGIDIGYAMSEATARDWGLWISERVVDKEPPIFSEAAMTWVGSDKTVLAHWQQSVPFARPPFPDILSGIDFVRTNNRPPRGSA